MVKNNQFEKNTIKSCEKMLSILLKHGKIPKQWGDWADYENEYLDLPVEEMLEIMKTLESGSELDQYKAMLKIDESMKQLKHTYRTLIKYLEDIITECKEKLKESDPR